MPTCEIVRLQSQHLREAFDCGNPALNDWLKLYAGQFERRNLARTFVAIRPPDHAICGYYAISNHAVAYESLAADQAKGLPRTDVPVVLLGQLAVSRDEQGRGLGSLLLVVSTTSTMMGESLKPGQRDASVGRGRRGGGGPR